MRTWLLLVLVCISISVAQEYPFDASLYSSKTITVQFIAESDITLSGSGKAEKMEAIVYYVPEEIGEVSAVPEPADFNPLTFTWNDVSSGTYSYSYQSIVENQAAKPRITQKVPYPFVSSKEVSQYLEPQEITDTNAVIQRRSSELASGKSDAIEVVFAIAQWVQQNVQYDLNTVTSQASQKASWVMQNREGVCDELTSLFISLSREAGIPARFVSGFAYTNLQGFEDHWGPHGWAEVWLPENGWVPVDVTYGQVLYTDATHIVIKRSLDSKNTAVDYSLLARSMALDPGELTTHIAVINKEGSITEELTKRPSVLYERVGSTSGNLIIASITNENKYYTATELYLATTPDTIVHDKRSQTILLPPQSTRRVSWRVTMPPFEPGYEYTIPFTIITQNAGNASVSVIGSSRYPYYPLPEKTQTVQNLLVECEEPPVLYPGEQALVRCTSENARVCAAVCGDGGTYIEFTAEAPGAYPVLVNATQRDEQGSAVVTFIVSAKPTPAISISMPQEANVEDTVSLAVQVETTLLHNSTVRVDAKRFNQVWNVTELESKGFELRFPAHYLSAGENTLTVTVSGTDKNGQIVTKDVESTITLQADFPEKIWLFFMHVLS